MLWQRHKIQVCKPNKTGINGTNHCEKHALDLLIYDLNNVYDTASHCALSFEEI